MCCCITMPAPCSLVPFPLGNLKTVPSQSIEAITLSYSYSGLYLFLYNIVSSWGQAATSLILSDTYSTYVPCDSYLNRLPCLAVWEISITNCCGFDSCTYGAANGKFCRPVPPLLRVGVNGPSGISDLIYDIEDVNLELDQSVQTLDVLWPRDHPVWLTVSPTSPSLGTRSGL